MIRDIREHSTDYAILGGFMSLIILGCIYNRGNTPVIASLVVLASLGYVIWGIVHHYRLHDLSAKIMAEYILMAILVMVVLTAVLYNR